MSDLLNPASDLDARAERLLRLGLSVAAMLRAVSPTQARKAMSGLGREELLDMATLLAACVDVDRRTSELLAWWTTPDLEESK